MLYQHNFKYTFKMFLKILQWKGENSIIQIQIINDSK